MLSVMPNFIENGQRTVEIYPNRNGGPAVSRQSGFRRGTRRAERQKPRTNTRTHTHTHTHTLLTMEAYRRVP